MSWFDPTPSNAYAFAREVWVQPASRGGFKVFRNVHNAACAFRRGNAMLDFYIHACEAVLRRSNGNVPNQIVGTKFLTALNNIIGFELMDDIGMISPLVARDLLAGTGPALACFLDASPLPLRAVNLCGSLVGKNADGIDLSDAYVLAVVERLITDGRSIFSRGDADL